MTIPVLIPSTISLIVFNKGAKIDYERQTSGPPRITIRETFRDHLSEAFEDCYAHFSVEQDKVVKIEDIEYDEEGRLKETIIGFEDTIDLRPTVSPGGDRSWISHFLRECDDLDNANMRALYRVAKEIIAKDEWAGKNYMVAYAVSFPGMWQITSHKDYETGIDEIDSIDFAGEMGLLTIRKEVRSPTHKNNYDDGPPTIPNS